MPAPYRPSTGAEAAQRWTAIDRRPGQQRALVRVRARGRAASGYYNRNRGISAFWGSPSFAETCFLRKISVQWQQQQRLCVCGSVSRSSVTVFPSRLHLEHLECGHQPHIQAPGPGS